MELFATAAHTGGMNLVEMWNQMGWVAKAIGVILILMSMWSFGVAIERYYTFSQARCAFWVWIPGQRTPVGLETYSI